MTQFLGRLAAGSLLLVVSGAVTFAQPQTPRTAAGCPLADPAKFHACAVEKMKTFTPPQTADGVANIQGYWDRAYTSQDIEEHDADHLAVTACAPNVDMDRQRQTGLLGQRHIGECSDLPERSTRTLARVMASGVEGASLHRRTAVAAARAWEPWGCWGDGAQHH